MKLNIDGAEYDYRAALTKIGIKHLLDLREQSGFGKRTVHEALDMLDAGLRAEEGETPEEQEKRVLEVQDDPTVLKGLAGLAFICKRHAGEDVSFDDVSGLAMGDLTFVIEEADWRSTADPTQALAAEAVQGSAGGRSRNGTSGPGKKSKTSKQPSTSV